MKLKPEEIKLAGQLVENLSGVFKPETFKDEFQERLDELIEAKLKGKTIALPSKSGKAPAVDIMEGLKKSLSKEQPRPKKVDASSIGRRQ